MQYFFENAFFVTIWSKPTSGLTVLWLKPKTGLTKKMAELERVGTLNVIYQLSSFEDISVYKDKLYMHRYIHLGLRMPHAKCHIVVRMV